MEPESWLPYSQEFATGPYPKPDESTPHPHIYTVSKIHFNIILSPTRGFYQAASCLQYFRLKFHTHM
jgi:hypothetical protein